MIKCPNCGVENIDGALFCDGCAWDLSAVPATPGEPAAAPPATSPSKMGGPPMSPSKMGGAPMAGTPSQMGAPMAGTPSQMGAPMAGTPSQVGAPPAEFGSAEMGSAEVGSAEMGSAEMAPVEGTSSQVMALEETVETGEVELSLEAAPTVGEAPPVTGATPSALGAPQVSPSQLGAPPVSPSKIGAPPASPSQLGAGAPPMSPSQLGAGAPPMSPSQLAGMGAPPPTSQLAQAAPPAGAPLAPSATVVRLSPIALAKLVVVRGVKTSVEYPVYEGPNFIGRFDEKPVDIDLTDQEDIEHPRASRQHACLSIEGGAITIEDLNSSNGTFVNRQRVNPGEKKPLKNGDYIQTGTVMFQLKC